MNTNRVNSASNRNKYNYLESESRRKILRFLLKYVGFTLLAKEGTALGIENIPLEGPAIIMINHIAFIDPIAVINHVPRSITPMAKVEVYNYPLVGILPKLYGVIPVHRGEIDRKAIRSALDVLNAGEIILVAPEGTRDPQLIEAKEGIAYLASRSSAPIIPTAVTGTEGYPTFPFSSTWRKQNPVYKFGQPFKFRDEYKRAKGKLLRKMTTEAMYILASMLPPERRGFYADLENATTDTIEWL